jgi:multiple sugar transport system ATP-binding protein
MRESFGTTIVYVTHDYSEALALGDRVAILHQGRVEQVGTSSHVFHQPLNRLVAGSLGDPPMNFLAGTIALDQNRSVFSVGNWQIPLPSSTRLRKYAGKEVCLGLRPQHLRLNCARPDTPFCMPSKLFVSVVVGDRLFMVLCEADQAYNLDESLYLAWAPEHIYLFSGDTGETLLAEGE